MADLWGTLVPLIIASAIVPLHLAVTRVFVQSSTRVAAAWVAGITAVRLIQGMLFGLVFTTGVALARSADRRIVASGVLLVLAVMLYATALRKALYDDDEEAPPPPKWKEKAESVGPLAAFGAGVLVTSVAVKFWIFTLGAIGAIVDAGLGRVPGILIFLLFVALGQSGHVALIALGVLSSGRSAGANGPAEWMKRSNRVAIVVVSLALGTWFLLKALSIRGII